MAPPSHSLFVSPFLLFCLSFLSFFYDDRINVKAFSPLLEQSVWKVDRSSKQEKNAMYRYSSRWIERSRNIDNTHNFNNVNNVRKIPSFSLSSSSSSSSSSEGSMIEKRQRLEEKLQREWEIDCYSRPVVGKDGKKLWELLITNGSGDFQHIEQIPSNMVNSRELRKLIQKVIDDVPSEKRPKVIRFFRKSMFNMINIALKEVKAKVIPSRCTQTLFKWISQREQEVYPKMEGYNAAMKEGSDSIFNFDEPSQMPEGLFGDKYAFVALPVDLFRNGEINYSNIGPGRLFEIDESIPNDEMIQGILIFSPRAQNIAAWLSSMELSTLKADFNRKQTIMEMGIDNYYLFGTINDARKAEAANFEKGKQRLDGIHFVGVQTDPEAEGIEGFFLLKEQPAY